MLASCVVLTAIVSLTGDQLAVWPTCLVATLTVLCSLTWDINEHLGGTVGHSACMQTLLQVLGHSDILDRRTDPLLVGISRPKEGYKLAIAYRIQSIGS